MLVSTLNAEIFADRNFRESPKYTLKISRIIKAGIRT